MPQHRRSISVGSLVFMPSVNSYLAFSTLLFVSGLYYYFKVLSTINFSQNIIIYKNTTITIGNVPQVAANTVTDKVFSVVLRHKLLFYILLNTCCAMITFIGKRMVEGLFNTLSYQEENLMKNSFRRYLQTKIFFLVFISHHNLFEDILIWMPWLALQLVCMLTLDLSSSRMSNLFDLVSNRTVRRRLFAANTIIFFLSLAKLAFVVSIRNQINFNYTLFLFSDCCLLLTKSVHLLLKLFTVVDVNAQRGHLTAVSSYYVDLAYDLIHDSIEFANYLHMIFFSRLAVTYCCIFLMVQAKHYYTRISTKIQKHRQHQEIIRHIGACYAKASDEDLLKNSMCTICWQLMKEARKLPCGHMFHELCLRRWLEQDSSCAICRQPLSLNLNNVLRRNELLGEDMDNAVQYFFESISPRENRFSQWLRQLLFNERHLTNEQVEAIVERIAEVFPNYERDALENAARETGSVSGAVDLLLERVNGRENQNDAANAFDSSDDDGDGGLNSDSDTDSNGGAALIENPTLEVAQSSSAADTLSTGECKIVDVIFNSSNPLFVARAKELLQQSRRKYMQSCRADDIRHLLETLIA